MFNGKPSSLFAFPRSGHSLYRRTLTILTARAAIFALGVSLGIRFGMELARNRVPALETCVCLGFCFLAQVIISTVQAGQKPILEDGIDDAAEAEVTVIYPQEPCNRGSRDRMQDNFSRHDRRCVAG